MTYRAPINDIKFALRHIVGIDDLSAMKAFEDMDANLIDAIMEEGGKFASGVLSPLNRSGDLEGAKLTDDGVIASPGFKDAYKSFVESGWNSLCGNPEFGGQGMPYTLGVAVSEMFNGANMAFSLCPMLTVGAIEALGAHGTDEQRDLYLEKLISGEWTGTMNLTEPQAGTDVGALRTKAEDLGDGRYKIKGQKIFITWGDHDAADNIIHLVLARLPDGPDGTRGISLFIVPKYHLNEDGSIGAANDLKCIALEHKLGIHASPTCVMSYGDEDNCIGYLIGGENKGMSAMFTMMNNARLNVGVLGVGCSELSYQMAADYALERTQGKPVGADRGDTIVEHADVRRMLMTIKSSTEAARAIALYNAKALDLSHHHPEEEARRLNKGLADLLTPLSKSYGSDMGVESASLAVQVFGGMGYIEETGIAQLYRDSRINPIYEGTNGVQAMDLVGRKLSMDGGEHWRDLLDEIELFASRLPLNGHFAMMRDVLSQAVKASKKCARWLLEQHQDNMRDTLAGSAPFQRLLCVTVGAYLLAKGGLSAYNQVNKASGDVEFFQDKITIAAFYHEHILSTALGLEHTILAGDELLFAIDKKRMAG